MVRELRYRVDDLQARSAAFVISNLRSDNLKLSEVSTRLSPIRLAAKVADNAHRLALLDQRTAAVGGELTRSRHRELEITMALLDAL